MRSILQRVHHGVYCLITCFTSYLPVSVHAQQVTQPSGTPQVTARPLPPPLPPTPAETPPVENSAPIDKPQPETTGESEPPAPTENEALPSTQESKEPAVTSPPADAPAVPIVPERGVFKGELIHPGTRRWISRYDHFGLSLGVNFIDSQLFLGVDPGLALYTDDWSFAVHVPLNLLLVDTRTIEQTEQPTFDSLFGGLKVRRQDWDEISDFPKVIRFLTIGREESPLYFSINSLRPTTVGHGMLMRHYQGNIDIDKSMTGAIFDWYNDYAGVEAKINDITFRNQIMGGLVYLKPMGFLGYDDPIWRSLSVGLEFLTDLKAPRCIEIASGGGCVQGEGHAADTNPYTGQSYDNTYVRSNRDTGRFATKDAAVTALGLTAQLRLYTDQKDTDIKGYATLHKFMNTGGGSGLGLGALTRLTYGETWIHALRFRSEYRTFANGFLPGYFDALYEIQKYEYRAATNRYQVTPTKYQAVFGDEENKFIRVDEGMRHGINLEASWGFFKSTRKNKKIAFGVGLQDSTGDNDTSAYAHLELPALQIVQLFGTYIRSNEKNIPGVFKDFTKAENSTFLTGLRLQVLPILFINAHYSRSHKIGASPGSEYHIGNSNILGQGLLEQAHLYNNVETVFVEFEFGWEFDDDDDDDDDETTETGGSSL